jgi:hypothetical protein
MAMSVERQYQDELDSLSTRIADLRFGIARIIEKARYDEYGSFESVRERIIALANEILVEDNGEGVTR